jgi:hypothetical protein
MDEQASFEPRSVLGSRRARWSRLRVIVPALALAAVAWIGISGQRPASETAAGGEAAQTSATATGASPADVQAAPELAIPNQALGLAVHRLGDVQPADLEPGAVIAIAGWYVATAIADCPPLDAFYRKGALPEVRGDIAAVDTWAFCDRTGVLYAAQPLPDGHLPTDDLDNNTPAALGLPAVVTSMVVGVVAPPQLETIGGRATPVVVISHFVPGPNCPDRPVCSPELVVDYVAWAAGV